MISLSKKQQRLNTRQGREPRGGSEVEEGNEGNEGKNKILQKTKKKNNNFQNFPRHDEINFAFRPKRKSHMLFRHNLGRLAHTTILSPTLLPDRFSSSSFFQIPPSAHDASH